MKIIYPILIARKPRVSNSKKNTINIATINASSKMPDIKFFHIKVIFYNLFSYKIHKII